MRTVLYGGVVAALAFSVCMVALSWFKDSDASGATQDAAFDIALAEDICSAENPSGNTAGEEMAHDHPLLEVLKDAPVPTVTHLVFPDAMDGYNIQILTENFTFTPAAINSAAVPNEGHAHLYVNGEKISRVYGNWLHLPASLLVDGPNAVSITLNANDHSEWAADGVAISSTVIVVKPPIVIGDSE